MDTLTISIPEDVHQWLDHQVASGRSPSIDDCICELIRKNQTTENIRNLLAEGEASGESELSINQIIEMEFKNNGQLSPIQ